MGTNTELANTSGNITTNPAVCAVSAGRAVRATKAKIELRAKPKAATTASTITGLHHVMLTVSDLDRSARFYRDILGLNVCKEVPDNGIAGAKVIFTMPDGRFFAVVRHGAGDMSPFSEKRTGIDHASFSIAAADLPAWQRRLRDAGIPCSLPARQPPANC